MLLFFNCVLAVMLAYVMEGACVRVRSRACVRVCVKLIFPYIQ